MTRSRRRRALGADGRKIAALLYGRPESQEPAGGNSEGLGALSGAPERPGGGACGRGGCRYCCGCACGGRGCPDPRTPTSALRAWFPGDRGSRRESRPFAGARDSGSLARNAKSL